MAVVSVEMVSFTVASGATSGSGALSGSQTEANCFVLSSISHSANWGAYAVEIDTGNVVATRDYVFTGTSADVVAYVVEMDAAVQRIDWSAAAFVSTGTETISAVTLANTFVISTGLAANDDHKDAYATVGLASTTSIAWERLGGGGTASGVAYVVEDTDFSVQQLSGSLTAANTTQSETISTVDLAETFVVATLTNGNDGNPRSTIYGTAITLPSTTSMRFDRNNAAAADSPFDACVVSVTGASVQAISGSMVSPDATDAVTITAVDLSAATAHMPNQHFGARGTDGFAGGYNDYPTVELTSTTAATFTVAENAGTITLDAFVVEWPIASGGITATGIASGESFGTAVLSPGAVSATASGIASGESFGAAGLSLQAVATGIATAEAFGAATLAPGASPLVATGIASGETHGASALSPGAVSVTPTGIATGEAHGAAVLTPSQPLVATGIATDESMGAAAVSPGASPIVATGIASSEAHGTSALGLDIAATGIATDESHGAAVLGLDITPTGIVTDESIGAAAIALAGIRATGIASGESFGDHVVSTESTALVDPTHAVELQLGGDTLVAQCGGHRLDLDTTHSALVMRMRPSAISLSTPTTINGSQVVFWLDPEQGVTRTGTPVDEWASVVNGYTWSAPADSRRPTYSATAGPRGGPALVSTSAGTTLMSSDQSIDLSGGPPSFYAVVRWDAYRSSSPWPCIMGCAPLAPSGLGSWLFCVGVDSGGTRQFNLSRVYASGTPSFPGVSLVGDYEGQWVLIEMHDNGASMEALVNGAGGTTVYNPASVFTWTNSAIRLFDGQPDVPTDVDASDVTIAEILCVTDQSATQRLATRLYLARKYSIGLTP